MRPKRLSTQEDASRNLQKLRSMNKSLYEMTARANTSFDRGKYKYLNDDIARMLVKADKIKREILGVYIDHYNLPSDLYEKMTVGERNQLSEMLYKYYISHKFDNMLFHEDLENIELSQITDFKDINGIPLTISEYVDMMVAEEVKVITNQITKSVFEHRKFWLANIPGFAFAIANTDFSNLKAPDEDGDVDVIEHVNLKVLAKIQPLVMDMVNIKTPSSAYVMTVVRAFQELIIEVGRINKGTKQLPEYLMINNEACDLVLDYLFPSCKGIISPNIEIPSYLSEFSTRMEQFSSVNPKIFWEYFQKVHIFYEEELGTVLKEKWRLIPEIKEKIKTVSDRVYTLRNQPSTLVITDAQKDRISLVTGNVEIYTTETCPYCIEAKELLTKNQINFNKDKGKQYTITNMSDLPQSVQEVLPTGHSSVPIIIVNRKFIGGLDDLKRILKAPYVRAVLR